MIQFLLLLIDPENQGAKEFRQAFAGIAELCRDHDISLVAAIFPFLYRLGPHYPFRPIHEAILDCCDELGVECVDLADAFPGVRGPELWVHPTDQHPNEKAHAIAAEVLRTPLRAALERSRRAGTPASAD